MKRVDKRTKLYRDVEKLVKERQAALLKYDSSLNALQKNHPTTSITDYLWVAWEDTKESFFDGLEELRKQRHKTILSNDTN